MMIGMKVLQGGVRGVGGARGVPSLLQQPRNTLFGKKKGPRKQRPEDIPCDHRVPSPCDICLAPDCTKPCFSLENVVLELATMEHENLIRSFLYTYYWPREPSCIGLWMPLNSLYLHILSDKYATTGDRWLAFEWQGRGQERKLIGVLVCNKVFPWSADELEDWAINTIYTGDRTRMYFQAHCLRSPNLFKKYHVPYIYDMEVLATASEVQRQGVGLMLVKRAIFHSCELMHPLTMMVAKSLYGAKICQRAGMQQEWSMDYRSFIDFAGIPQFYPRDPHFAVSVFSHKYNPKLGLPYPCPKLT